MSETTAREQNEKFFKTTFLFTLKKPILFGLLAGIIVLFLAFLPAPGTSAQDNPPSTPKPTASPLMRFTHPLNLGVELTTMLQDRDGFMWIGTTGGLVRYDGYGPQFFSAGPHSVNNNTILSLVEDRDGVLWIGTRGGGLNKYDRQTNTFTYYRHDPTNVNSLSSNSLNIGSPLIMEDRAGYLWIGTDTGLDRFDKQATFTHYRHDPDNPDSLSSNGVFSVIEDRDGFLWIGTDVGLDRLNLTTGIFTHYRNDPANSNSLGLSGVYTVHEDHDGFLWIGGEKRLDKLDKQTGVFTHFKYDPANPSGLPAMGVLTIHEASTGELLLGSFNSTVGLCVFDRLTETLTTYKHDPNDAYSLSTNLVRLVFDDRVGIRWVVNGTGELDQYDPYRPRFELWQANPNNPNSLDNNVVVSFTGDSAGIFWIATLTGLNRYDPKAGTFTHYTHDPADPMSLSNTFTLAMLEDSTGDFWVSTYDGLCLFDRGQGRCTRQVAFQAVYGMIEDSTHPGWFWLGTLGQGIYKYDKASGAITHYANDPANPGSLANNIVRILKEDKANPNILWLPTQGGGLDRFDKTTETFTHYQHDPNNPTSIGANQVFDIHEDRAGNFWVATGGSGLNKFDRAAGTFKHYTKEDRFPTNEVRNILEDAAGNLWMGTDIGLVKFDPRTEKSKVYHGRDGLQGDSFLQNAHYQTPEGQMWFGGVNGANSFFPEEITDNSLVPPVYLTALSQGGEPIALETAPEYLKAVTLTWPNAYFEFQYVALNYTQSEKNQYAYKLEGIDADWYSASFQRSGRYSNLPGGTYTLRIKGSNNDGVWNDNGVAIQITVIPPWWELGWVRGLAAVLIIGGIAGIVGLRIRGIETQRRHLTIQVEERTKELTKAKNSAEAAQRAAEVANQTKSAFLSNMSHELRSPLNTILGYAELITRQPALPRQTQEDLGTIISSGNHLLALINQVLDLSKVEAGRLSLNETAFDLYGLLDDLADMFAVTAEKKGLLFVVDCAPEVPQFLRADETKLRQVLINLLSNALKFTTKGRVTLQVSTLPPTPENTTTHRLSAAVIDTGPGIAPEELPRLFDTFVQAKAGQQAQEGTGLGLAISRSFVRLMGGEIQVESQVGRGTTMSFILPINAVEASEVAAQTGAPERRVTALESGQPVYRILAVDDHWTSRQLLVRLLKSLGFEVREASDGQEALAIWDEWSPHLIWMDLRMPVMDGYETTRRIKAAPKGQTTRIIALTASSFEEERSVILATGCDDFLRKPFHEADLLDMMRKHLGLKFVYDETPVSAPPTAQPAAEALALLPRDLLAALERALTRLDIKAIAHVMDDIRAHDTPLADTLAALVKDFQYGKILRLIQQVHDQAGEENEHGTR